MNKFLQTLVLLLVCTFIISQENDIVNEDAITKTRVVIVANEAGKSVKVAKNCRINIKETLRSLKTLDNDVEKDLEVHILYHKGIVLNKCEILNKEKADLIFLRIDEDTHIIQYRFLSSVFSPEEDSFLGHSISVLFKTGQDNSSFGCELSLTFGNCNFCSKADENVLEPMNSSTNSSLASVFKVLTKANKALLEAKLNAAEAAAKQYSTYNTLYKEAISKKSFAEQIPELEAKISAKKAECTNYDKNLQSDRSNLDNQRQIYAQNADVITKCDNDIVSFNAQRKQLETEQVNRRNAATGHAATEKDFNAAKSNIQNIVKMVSDLVPGIFDGINCFNADGEITQQCIDIINSDLKNQANLTRYVKLTMPSPGDHDMNLSQIACYNKSGENVTKGKNVTPNLVARWGISPNNLTDGTLTTRPHPLSYHSERGSGDWVSIDLVNPEEIEKCVIYNRADCCKHRVIGAKLSLLRSDSTEIDNRVVSKGDDQIELVFNNQVSYVKLQMANVGDNWMNLSQIACFNKNGDNVTKGKNVSVNAPSPYGINPNNLTDGNLIPRPHPQSYHSPNGGNDWVSIDLVNPEEITRCEIYNRSDCCGNRVKGASLMLITSNNSMSKSQIVPNGDPKIVLDFSK